MRSFKGLLVVAMLALTAGCGTMEGTGGSTAATSSQFGIQRCDTFRECLAYGYALNASVRKGAAGALDRKVIGVADARRILADTDTTRTVLDEARKLESVDATTALGKVEYAVAILRAGETFLNRGGK